MRFIKAILDELSDVVAGMLAVMVFLITIFSSWLAAGMLIGFVEKCCDYSSLEWYEWFSHLFMFTGFGVTAIISYAMMKYLWRRWNLSPRKETLGKD